MPKLSLKHWISQKLSVYVSTLLDTSVTSFWVRIFSDNESRLIENDTEDILHIINMQLLITKNHLSITNCQRFLVTCLEELEVLQGLTRITLETNWKYFNPERLCSIVNITRRLYNKCETLAFDQKMELGLATHKKLMRSLLDTPNSLFMSPLWLQQVYLMI
jgi:hypothetical protein